MAETATVKIVKLKSSDDVSVEVPMDIATMSVTIKNMLEGSMHDSVSVADIYFFFFSDRHRRERGGNSSPERVRKGPRQGVRVLQVSGLPSVSSRSRRIFFRWHHANPSADVKKDDKDRALDDIIPWDKEFTNVDQETLFQLILASNYLDVKPLLDLTCKTVALMIRGKTPEAIR